MAGEFDLIDWIRAQHPPTDFVPVPQGDDLAVLKWPADDLLLVGVDQVLEGVHFDSAVHTPRQIGRKVMNRNLSDCAAMACLPAAAVATVALPRGVGVEYAKELYLGLRDAADPFGCVIVGGDTGSWPGKLVATVTVLGRSAGIAPVTRKGARPGDGIYVTGPLGGSLLGRHMTFEPRVTWARLLALQRSGGQLAASIDVSGVLAGDKPIVEVTDPRLTAMIDLSDGLSRDLRHICRESGVGAIVDADQVPIHPDAHAAFRVDRVEPLQHALHDGEDYELLFTGRDFTGYGRLVGEIVHEPADGPLVQLRTKRGLAPLEPQGWQHAL